MRVYRAQLLFLLLALSTCALNQTVHSFDGVQPTDDPDPRFQQAFAEMEGNQFEQARATLNEILLNEPDEIHVNYLAGLVGLELLKCDEAVQHFEKVRAQLDDYRIHVRLTLAYGCSGDVQKRDAERKLIFDSFRAGRVPSYMQGQPYIGILIDKFPSKEWLVETLEYSRPLVVGGCLYQIWVLDRDKKQAFLITLKRIGVYQQQQMSTAPGEVGNRDQGGFVLAAVHAGKQVNIHSFKQEPSYDAVREEVVNFLSGSDSAPTTPTVTQ